MSINFSANQYPARRDGFSTFHANDRGHLLPNVPRRRESPWGTFVGTWDMPCHLPGTKQLDPSCRSMDARLRLQDKAENVREVLSGGLKKTRMFSPLPQRIVRESSYSHDDDYNNAAAHPAMGAPTAHTEEQMALKSRLTPPGLPMSHDVSGFPPLHVDQLVVDEGSVVPRPEPTTEGVDIAAHKFEVVSPPPPEPCTVTATVDSLQHTVIEEP